MKHFFAGLILALTVIFSSTAMAQQSPNYARSGFYFGAGALYAIEYFDTSSTRAVDNDAGFNFRAGYRFSPHIAIEGMGERVDKFEFSDRLGGGVDTWTATLNGKAFLLTDRFQPYGLFGIGYMRADSTISDPIFGIGGTNTDLTFRFGGGVDTYLTEHMIANFEITYVNPTDTVSDFDYLSLGGGIQFRF